MFEISVIRLVETSEQPVQQTLAALGIPRSTGYDWYERYRANGYTGVKLDTSCFPWELEQAVADFVVYFDTQRYHKSLENVTPADVYFGRHKEVLSKRELIKQQTLHERRQHPWHMTVQAV